MLFSRQIVIFCKERCALKSVGKIVSGKARTASRGWNASKSVLLSKALVKVGFKHIVRTATLSCASRAVAHAAVVAANDCISTLCRAGEESRQHDGQLKPRVASSKQKDHRGQLQGET